MAIEFTPEFAPSLPHDEMMRDRYSAKVTPNGAQERRIVWNLIRFANAHGWALAAVSDGEDTETFSQSKAGNALPAMGFIFERDSNSTLTFQASSARKSRFGVLLVPGNGEDIVSDWSFARTDDGRAFDAMMSDWLEVQEGVL